jgi:uncharacterized protein GlcG (DUF336 family)
MSIAYRLAGCGVVALLATPASAQLLNHKDLSMATALTIATTAIETCKGQGYRVSATVLGRNGEVIVQLRGDDTGPPRSRTARRRPIPRAPSASRRVSSSSASRTTRRQGPCS